MLQAQAGARTEDAGKDRIAMRIVHSSIELTQGTFNIAQAGDPDMPLILCLHGFPESWLAYEGILEKLGARGYHVVAPDQRGFNRSPKPEGVDAYHSRHLAADMFELADRISPDSPFVVMGHDWGSAVAYVMAFMRPDRISHLIVANGVHPWCFQNAIINDPAQRAASQYMSRLRRDDARRLMADNDFARTFRMMSDFSSADWLSPDLEAAYKEQWSEPGALDAMLNWYRASPVVVPSVGDTAARAPLLDLPPEAMTVHMPHLVIWGEDDTALLPACLEGLSRFAPDLRVRRFEGTGHWILHECPEQVCSEVFAFLDGRRHSAH